MMSPEEQGQEELLVPSDSTRKKPWGVLGNVHSTRFLHTVRHSQCSWRWQEGQTRTWMSISILTGDVKG